MSREHQHESQFHLQPRQADLLEIHQDLVHKYQALEHPSRIYVIADTGPEAHSIHLDLSSVPKAYYRAIWSDFLHSGPFAPILLGDSYQQVYVFAYGPGVRELMAQVREPTEAHGWHIVHADATGCIDITATPETFAPAGHPAFPTAAVPSHPVSDPSPDPAPESGPELGATVLSQRLRVVEQARALFAAQPLARLSVRGLAAVSEALADPWVHFGVLTWDDVAAAQLWRVVARSAPQDVRPVGELLLACTLSMQEQFAASLVAFDRAHTALTGMSLSDASPGVGPGAEDVLELLARQFSSYGQWELARQQMRLAYVVERVLRGRLNRDQIAQLIQETMSEEA